MTGNHIAPAITDHNASFEIDLPSPGSGQQHPWLRLSALAPFVLTMGAHHDVVQCNFLSQPLVHRIDHRAIHLTIANIGLVRHRNHQEPRLL
jgi:hypothetical protein